MPRRTALLVVLTTLLTACGGQSDPDVPDSSATGPTPTEAEPEDVGTDDAKTVDDESGRDDDTGQAAGNGLFASASFCVPDQPDDDCGDRNGEQIAACTLEWSPAAEDVLTGDGELTYEFLYEQEPILSGSVPFAAIRDAEGALAVPLELTFNLGGLPFASGSYQCHADDGHDPVDESATVTSGPTDPVYGMAVCDLGDAVETGGSRVCPGHVEEFADVTEVNCSAGVASLGASELLTELVWTPPKDSQSFTEKRVHLSIEPTGSPLHALNIFADASAFDSPGSELSPGMPLPEGDYICRFSEGDSGEVLSEMTFAVAGS